MEMCIGLDEVGRGCLAGDLVVCAYAFSPALDMATRASARALAMDSKKFSSRSRRAAAAARLRDVGIFAFARRSPAQIDATDIRRATLGAFAEAATTVRERLGGPVRVIADGRDIPEIGPPVEARVKGDADIPEIGAASILAKTLRDAEMDQLAQHWPGYGFETHAGYGTPAHRAAITRLGLSPVHRSWARKFAS